MVKINDAAGVSLTQHNQLSGTCWAHATASALAAVEPVYRGQHELVTQYLCARLAPQNFPKQALDGLMRARFKEYGQVLQGLGFAATHHTRMSEILSNIKTVGRGKAVMLSWSKKTAGVFGKCDQMKGEVPFLSKSMASEVKKLEPAGHRMIVQAFGSSNGQQWARIKNTHKSRPKIYIEVAKELLSALGVSVTSLTRIQGTVLMTPLAMRDFITDWQEKHDVDLKVEKFSRKGMQIEKDEDSETGEDDSETDDEDYETDDEDEFGSQEEDADEELGEQTVSDKLRDCLTSLGFDAADLTLDELGKLKKGGLIEPKQAALLEVMIGREQKLQRDRLPCPDLKKGEPLSFQRMLAFEADLPALLQPSLESSAPIDLGELTPAHWMKVFLNCNLSRGLQSQSWQPAKHVLIPPNEKLYPKYMAAAPFAFKSNCCAVKDSKDKDMAVQADLSAFLNVDARWLCGGARVQSAATMGQQVTEREETCITILKERHPIGTLSLTPSQDIKVEANDTGTFGVNPDFIRAVEVVLQKPVLTREILERDIFQVWGDVFITKAELGSAQYKTDMRTVKVGQRYSEAASAFQMEVNKQVPRVVKGNVALDIGIKGREESVEAQQHSQSQWQLLGGGISSAHSTAEHRCNPNHWRVIHVSQVEPVISLLPKAMREQLETKLAEAELAEKKKAEQELVKRALAEPVRFEAVRLNATQVAALSTPQLLSNPLDQTPVGATLEGAVLGATVGGPWGAAIGAGVGAAVWSVGATVRAIRGS